MAGEAPHPNQSHPAIHLDSVQERDVNHLTITIYGVCAVTFMMVMYALEGRDRRFVVAFAVGCLLSSAYGFFAGAWPFGVVEVIWSGVALRRFLASAQD